MLGVAADKEGIVVVQLALEDWEACFSGHGGIVLVVDAGHARRGGEVGEGALLGLC